MTRLPVPGGDDGTWGSILNGFLDVAHNSDGSLQTAALSAAGGVLNVNGQTPTNGTVTLGASNLSDVAITSPGNNQALVYDSTTQKWINQAVSGGSGSTDWINVKSAPYYAMGDGATDDTTALQNAINAAQSTTGGTIYFPAGTYKISSALTISTSNDNNNVILMGPAGGNSFSLGNVSAPCIIKQTSTTAHGLYAHNGTNITVMNLTIQGPGSGSGDGIHFDWFTDTNFYGVGIYDTLVCQFGGSGIYVETGLMANYRRVTSAFNNYGFYINGGTSSTFESCWAEGNTTYGWYITGNYMTWNGCGADGNGTGWYLTNCQCCSINGSGSEGNILDGMVINGGLSNEVHGFWVSNHRYAVHVTSTSFRVTLSGILESPLSGAVYSILTESGSIVTMMNNGLNSPTSLAGNYQIILEDGGVNAGSAVYAGGVSSGAAITAGVLALTDGANIAVDASLGNTCSVTLGGNRTLSNPTNPTNGQQLVFAVTQDGSGNRTLSYGTAYEFSAVLPQPTLSTGAGKSDYLTFIYDSGSGKWRFINFVSGF